MISYQAVNTVTEFDCEQDYTNEKEVSDGLKIAMVDVLGKRELLFVISKLWNNVEAALDRTLGDLKLDYLYIFLMHFQLLSSLFHSKKSNRLVHAVVMLTRLLLILSTSSY